MSVGDCKASRQLTTRSQCMQRTRLASMAFLFTTSRVLPLCIGHMINLPRRCTRPRSSSFLHMSFQQTRARDAQTQVTHLVAKANTMKPPAWKIDCRLVVIAFSVGTSAKEFAIATLRQVAASTRKVHVCEVEQPLYHNNFIITGVARPNPHMAARLCKHNQFVKELPRHTS